MAKKAAKKKSAPKKSAAKPPVRAKAQPAALDPIAEALRRQRAHLLGR